MELSSSSHATFLHNEENRITQTRHG